MFSVLAKYLFSVAGTKVLLRLLFSQYLATAIKLLKKVFVEYCLYLWGIDFDVSFLLLLFHLRFLM